VCSYVTVCYFLFLVLTPACLRSVLFMSKFPRVGRLDRHFSVLPLTCKAFPAGIDRGCTKLHQKDVIDVFVGHRQRMWARKNCVKLGKYCLTNTAGNGHHHRRFAASSTMHGPCLVSVWIDPAVRSYSQHTRNSCMPILTFVRVHHPHSHTSASRRFDNEQPPNVASCAGRGLCERPSTRPVTTARARSGFNLISAAIKPSDFSRKPRKKSRWG
jgi:hypothetical protein